MAFDIEMIKAVYAQMSDKIEAARKVLTETFDPYGKNSV